MKKYLVPGGILNILLGAMHFTFWHLFNWPKSLECLDPANRGIMEVLNIHGAITILFMGIISLFFVDDLIKTKLGKASLLFIALFYFIRVINEFIFWPVESSSFIMGGILLILALLYFIPFCIALKKPNIMGD